MILGDTYLHRIAVTWVPWRLKSLTTRQFVQQVTKGPQCWKYFHDMARSRLILLPSSVSSPIIIIVIATIFIAVIITIDHRSSSRMITNFAFMNSLWRSVYNKQWMRVVLLNGYHSTMSIKITWMLFLHSCLFALGWYELDTCVEWLCYCLSINRNKAHSIAHFSIQKTYYFRKLGANKCHGITITRSSNHIVGIFAMRGSWYFDWDKYSLFS